MMEPVIIIFLLPRDGRKFTDNGIPDPSLCTCGYDAFRPEIRQKCKLIFPLRATLKVDKVCKF